MQPRPLCLKPKLHQGLQANQLLLVSCLVWLMFLNTGFLKPLLGATSWTACCEDLPHREALRAREALRTGLTIASTSPAPKLQAHLLRQLIQQAQPIMQAVSLLI